MHVDDAVQVPPNDTFMQLCVTCDSVRSGFATVPHSGSALAVHAKARNANFQYMQSGGLPRAAAPARGRPAAEDLLTLTLTLTLNLALALALALALT